MEPLWTPSELLHKLVSDYLDHKIGTKVFCTDIVNAYNDAVDERALTDREHEIFEKLFDEAAWYSPFPEERAVIPNYRNDGEIWQAAERASAMLKAISN